MSNYIDEEEYTRMKAMQLGLSISEFKSNFDVICIGAGDFHYCPNSDLFTQQIAQEEDANCSDDEQ